MTQDDKERRFDEIITLFILDVRSLLTLAVNYDKPQLYILRLKGRETFSISGLTRLLTHRLSEFDLKRLRTAMCAQ